MMYITYHAPDNTMGNTPPDACAQFRAWAKSELEREFPEHIITVTDEPSVSQVHTDDEENEDHILTFCRHLWDRCPWDF